MNKSLEQYKWYILGVVGAIGLYSYKKDGVDDEPVTREELSQKIANLSAEIETYILDYVHSHNGEYGAIDSDPTLVKMQFVYNTMKASFHAKFG